jgi:hypothetical protein
VPSGSTWTRDLCFTRARHKIKQARAKKDRSRRSSRSALLHTGISYSSYFPIPSHVGAGLTRLLQGKVRPFVVSRNFTETIGYVTDRKAGPLADGNVTYLSEYAGQVSYGLINVQVPQHHPFSSPIDSSAIKKVDSIPYPAFLQFLQDQSGKPFSHLPERFSPDTNLDEIQTFLYYEKQLPGQIDLVDVSFSSKQDALKKHRLFLERPVLEDLYWLIRDDYPAAKRHLLKYNGSKTSTDYWVIPP